MLDLSLPAGLRDLLPDHSARLAELAARLHGVFASFGYRRVLLPTLERLEVVELGLSPAAARDVLKFVEASGEVVAIRPDITPQIARLYAARPDALPAPARLCYDGPVLRAREARAGRPREVYMAGVELLGEAGPGADAEALVVLARALERLGLRHAVMEVGHAQFAQAIVRAAGLTPGAEHEAAVALSRKDEVSLAALARRGTGARAACDALPSLAGLYGEGALERARRVARAAPAASAALREVEAALRRARARGLPQVAVDLGEVRELGYYTGITFTAYAPGAGSWVASGGRYDDLLARFGRPGPAIGFGFDLAFATEALERAGARAPARAQARSRLGTRRGGSAPGGRLLSSRGL
jgi:ATP phosphoribosyltransferase regulatory subunit